MTGWQIFALVGLVEMLFVAVTLPGAKSLDQWIDDEIVFHGVLLATFVAIGLFAILLGQWVPF